MVINRKRKTHKQRAGTTHGHGSMKKNRGAGHRGGRGRAGSGKRGDSTKPTFRKQGRKMGKYGFTAVNKVEQRTINIHDLNTQAITLAKEGKAEKKGDAYAIDLSQLGYDKLLAKGTPLLKLNLTVPKASASAISKIEEAGGSVEVTDQDVFEPAEGEAEE